MTTRHANVRRIPSGSCIITAILLALLVLGARLACAATFYAAPGGTGDGKTAATPGTVVSAVALCPTEGTVELADGTYTGAAGMISLRAKVNVVVRATNDGKVLIDGEGVRRPVYLERTTGCVVEGLDACRSIYTVIEVQYGYNNTIRRVCAWEAGDGNFQVFGTHWSTRTRFEDCAGWGRARKVFSDSQDCNFTIWTRCWGRWERCTLSGPACVFESGYDSYNGLLVNCIGTWDGVAAQPYGIFSVGHNYPDHPTHTGVRFLGCLAYQLGSQRGRFYGGFFVSRVDGVTVQGCQASIAGGSPPALLAANDRHLDGGSCLIVRDFANHGGKIIIDTHWTQSGVVERMPLPQTAWKLPEQGEATGDGVVDVGDMGILSANWGAKPRYKGTYEVGDFNCDGIVDVGDLAILSANMAPAKPLWPWPMEQRIKAAMVKGGYPPISVTGQVREAFGP